MANVNNIANSGPDKNSEVEIELDKLMDSRSSKPRFRTPLWITLLVLSTLGMAISQFLEIQHGEYQSNSIESASSIATVSQQLAKNSREAALGNELAFEKLKSGRDEIDQALTALSESVQKTPEYKAVPAISSSLQALSSGWETSRKNVDTLLDKQDVLLKIRERVSLINEIAPLLLAQADEVVDAVIKTTSDARMANIAARQRLLSQRIAKDVNIFALGGENAAVSVTQFGKDTKLFQATSQQLRSIGGAYLLARIKPMDKTFATLNDNIEDLLNNVADFFVAQEAAQLVVHDSQSILESTNGLVRSYSGQSLRYWLPWLCGALAAFSLLMLVGHLVRTARTTADDSAELNRRNEESILNLLNQMSGLADGDLTVEAEVTENITGAIADSINYAISEMRDLVRQINNASATVASESDRTSDIAQQLASTSDNQNSHIQDITGQLQQMAESVDRMSEKATSSAAVAENSMSVAQQGARAVRDTIDSMNALRDQIQDTSKRIKRLGESSQQITDVVRLIDGIAEQTNILSLNAAIQAASAGEAGRGFAVVADEVQRLAERSSEATKQIDRLVANIQTDAKEAVASMESATQGVVEGAQRADIAGSSLSEIESVVTDLTILIREIANSATEQSGTATEVTQSMESVRGMTVLVSEDARKTSDSIDRLALLARELQSSVSRFKLPAA